MERHRFFYGSDKDCQFRQFRIIFIIFCAVVFIFARGMSFEKPFVYALKTEVQPVIDGKLDEDCWALGESITNFTQVLPLEGEPPTENTKVKFLYDENYLYIGIWCYDSEPRKIIAKQMQRDAILRSDDYVKIALDTFGRQQFGYFFAINPAGARVDGQIQDFYVERKNWDAVWTGKSRITEFGWIAEIAIPFKSIAFDLSRGYWGCNIERVVRRKQEVIRWTAISPSREMTLLSDFGELRGVTNIHQGLGLEIKPVMSVAFKESKIENYNSWKLKPGLDISYNITPSIVGQATFNTDFAEAEVDDRMVNLTRFPLFYPEKREFFARDSTMFSFGGIEYSPLPFYSRRIGLDADGKPVDIIAGGRITGRFDGTSLALLNVQQDAYKDIKSKNLSVARISHGIWDSSSVGIIGTYGDPLSNGDAGLLGVDFNYINNEVFNSKQFILRSYVMGSQSDVMDGEDVAFGVDLDYPNEPLDLHTTFRQNGTKFHPALGFIDRRGIRSYRQAVRYIWRLNKKYVRTFSVGILPTLKTDLSNRIVEEDHDLPFLSITTPKGDSLYGVIGLNRDVIEEPFQMWDNVTIQPRDYRWVWGRISIVTGEARIIGGNVAYRFGNFYNGKRNDYQVGMSLRPSKHLLLGGSYEIRDIDLPTGSFIVRIFSTRLNLQFTPDLILNNTIQYDNDTNLLGLNTRFRWTMKPGNDLYVTFNNGYLFEDWNLRMHIFETSLKVALTIRF